MRFRHLGRTGLVVSEVGFGASPLGNVYNDVSSAVGDRAVARAVEQGINLFDVSPYYGETLAETRLGQALRGRRNSVLVATKCGRYGVDTFDFSAATIIREFDNSLRRLGTEYVDILQAHDVEFANRRQIVEETMPAMQRLRQQGKARFLGLTGYWPGLLASLAEQTGVDCVLNYCHANVFVDDMLVTLEPISRRTGLGLLNASPLHMGLLGSKPIPSWHPAPLALQDVAKSVREVCRQYGVDPGVLALHASLRHEAVSSTFVGFADASEVDIACTTLAWSPPEGLLDEVEVLIQPVHNMVWPSGLAANQDTQPVPTGGGA